MTLQESGVVPNNPEASYKAAETLAKKNSVASSLGLPPQDIAIVEAAHPDNLEKRFVYGFTKGKKIGFFKVSPLKYNLQLERESAALTIAATIGIPVVDILEPFQTMPDGGGILLLKKMDLENGELFGDNNKLATAPTHYGARSAVILQNAVGCEIPNDIDSSLLNRDDSRNKSPETFWKVWEEQESKVFAHETVVEELVGMLKLKSIVGQVRTDIEPEIIVGINPDVEYLVHNDASPDNIFFGEKDILFDFEHTGATHNRTLAQLTDLANFYGKLWPNPAMQKVFLETYMEISPSESLEYNYKLLRASIVFGAISCSQYFMQTEDGVHPQVQSLLGNLEAHLALLDSQYQTQIGVHK